MVSWIRDFLWGEESEKVDEGVPGFLGALFYEPMAGVFEDDDVDVAGD
jgi:hypothetical protein